MATVDVWNAAKDALIAGDAPTLQRLLQEHESLFRDEHPPHYGTGGLAPDYSPLDARAILVRNHHVESWEAFETLQRARHEQDSPVANFEAAVDAIVTGDEARLAQLLAAHPELVRARSVRSHHSTLLHYVGANGVEAFRQKTPKNIVDITKRLLAAGADVAATAGMYGGGSTTLELVATSIHPQQAGVQEDLLDVLIDAGAVPDGVNGSLANGRGRAAEYLASRGAPLDLEGAAGVGRLDLVERYFNADGSLKPDATPKQLLDGFTWACEYGRTAVVAFLLDHGVPIDARVRHHGQTGLHWAALGGHVDTVALLLGRYAPVNVRDEQFHGTPLAWALEGWSGLGADDDADRERYAKVAAQLVAAGNVVEEDWLIAESIRADPLMLAALRGEAPPRS